MLIRAVEPLYGIDIMAERRDHKKAPTNGPGKLMQAFGIGLAYYRRELFEPGFKNIGQHKKVSPRSIAVSTKIGITNAADLMLRFYVASSEFLSRPHRM